MNTMRPESQGTRHVVSTGHAYASQAAFQILEDGGNAIDAGVCAGLALGHSVPAVVIFSVARGLQMAAVPLSIFVLEFDVPTTLAWVSLSEASGRSE